MIDPVQVRTLILTALSAAIIGATLVDERDASAATPAVAADGPNCPGFQQHHEFNELITFNEFESCTFQEYQEEFQQIVEPLDDTPFPEIPEDIPGFPGGPGPGGPDPSPF
jgi:hypothetical protein